MFNCLLKFFPKVITYVILEYCIPVIHEFEKTKNIKIEIDIYTICMNNVTYNYFSETNILRQIAFQENIINPCKIMCIYNNYIYVTKERYINVFNNKCELVYELLIFEEKGIFTVADNNIFFCDHRDNIVHISPINGIIYDSLTKKHNIKTKKKYD